MIDKFNIRVYGIWIKDGKILLSREEIGEYRMLKLPGGGLEFGEGPAECLIREFREELNIDINIKQHIYTTDYFIQSRFRVDEQVLALYYSVESAQEIQQYSIEQGTRLGNINRIEFSWVDWEPTIIDSLSFESDKSALRCLKGF